MPLINDELGYRGQVDAVIEEGDELIPVEYKIGKGPPDNHDRAAVALVAMALELSAEKQVKKSYLYYTGERRRYEINIDADLRNFSLMLLQRARKILGMDSPPKATREPKCKGCCWEEICAPDLEDAVEARKKARVVPRSRFDRVLYVDKEGCYVRKSGGSLIVTKDRETIASVGIQTLDQVILVGRGVHISTPALRELCSSNIDVVLLTKSGRCEGRLWSPGLKNPALKRAQFQKSLDPAFKLRTSLAIVRAKINNQRIMLQRLKRKRKIKELDAALNWMQKLSEKALRAEDVSELMGFEGEASKAYFNAISAVVRESGFSMTGRSRRPPRDRFNSILSFCYSMLLKEVLSALEIAGLDPCIGLFHSEKYGRPALALDIMEEFRPIIADAVALKLVNQKIIQPEHFLERLGIYELKESGRKKVYETWENKMTEPILHPLFRSRFSYRRTIEAQARILAKSFEGETKEYIPFRAR